MNNFILIFNFKWPSLTLLYLLFRWKFILVFTLGFNHPAMLNSDRSRIRPVYSNGWVIWVTWLWLLLLITTLLKTLYLLPYILYEILFKFVFLFFLLFKFLFFILFPQVYNVIKVWNDKVVLTRTRVTSSIRFIFSRLNSLFDLWVSYL